MQYLSSSDTLEKILPYLDLRDVLSMMFTCKHLSNLIRDTSDIWIWLMLSIRKESSFLEMKNRLRYLDIPSLYKIFINLRLGRKYSFPANYHSDYYHAFIINKCLRRYNIWNLYDITEHSTDIHKALMLNHYFMNMDGINYFTALLNDVDNIKAWLSGSFFNDQDVTDIMRHVYLTNHNIYITNVRVTFDTSNCKTLQSELELSSHIIGDEFFYILDLKKSDGIYGVRHSLIDKDTNRIYSWSDSIEEFHKITRDIAQRLNVDNQALNNVVVFALSRGNRDTFEDNEDLLLM